MMRKFKIVKVSKVLKGTYYGKIAINKVRGDCGHLIETSYWPTIYHYSVGDRIRCYECGKT